MVDFSFIVSLYVSDLLNVTIRKCRTFDVGLKMIALWRSGLCSYE